MDLKPEVDVNPKMEPEPLLCMSCNTNITTETAIPCEWCDIYIEKGCVLTLESLIERNVPPLFCKKCTLQCDSCLVSGCKECVEVVCCDCDDNMCKDCRDNINILCGCNGKCYTCNIDVHRGSEGWPCGECKVWYCDDCRRGENLCKECGPNEDKEQ